MMVMPSNNGHHLVHYWAGLYGGLAHLYSPGGQRGPFRHLAYSLDNGAFPCWEKGTEWDEAAFLDLLQWSVDSGKPPMWVPVPDVVTDAEATLRLWPNWSRRIRDLGLLAALVVQDGMTPADVSAAEPDVVFVGGSSKWKWNNVWTFTGAHPRVHVGRVNGYRGLVICHNAGVESCDGTGWFRGSQPQLAGLERYLRQQSEGRVPPDCPLFHDGRAIQPTLNGGTL